MDSTTVSQGGTPGGGVTTLECAGGVGHSLVGEGKHTGLSICRLAGIGTEICGIRIKDKCLYNHTHLAAAVV